MIKLVNKTDVDGASTDFPNGSVRDETPTVIGTSYDKNTMSDMFQFFEKMFIESGITPNNVLDNETNGYQLYESLLRVTRPYKVFIGRISQNGTSNPTVVVLENTLGEVPTFTRVAAGSIVVATTTAFVEAKLWHSLDSNTINKHVYSVINGDDINISVRNEGSGVLDAGADDGLQNAPIEIRVYY